MAEEIDIRSMGKIGINDFQNFCNEYNIPFRGLNIEKYRQDAKKKKGEELKVGSLTYIITEEDYFRGIPTILNSEEAAIVICEKIAKSLKPG